MFETLERLKDKDDPLELDRARAICEVSQALINSAKVEVQFLKEVGGLPENGFFTKGQEALPAGETGKRQAGKPNGQGVI